MRHQDQALGSVQQAAGSERREQGLAQARGRASPAVVAGPQHQVAQQLDARGEPLAAERRGERPQLLPVHREQQQLVLADQELEQQRPFR